MAKSAKMTKVGPGRRKKVEGLSIRNVAVDAYIELFQVLGPQGVTVEKIAKAAGISVTTLRYYFPDWTNDLNNAAIQMALGRGLQWVESEMFARRAKQPFDPIQAYIDVIFDWAKQCRSDASFLVYFYFLATTSMKTPISNSTFLGQARLRIEGLLNEGIGLKRYGIEEADSDLVLKIHGAILGMTLVSGTEGSEGARETQRRVCKKLVLEDLLRAQKEPSKNKIK